MKKYTVLLFIVFFAWSCSDNGPSGPNPDDFDREAILVNWGDNIIVPSFTDLSEATAQLHTSAETFSASPTLQNLETLRGSWESAYLAFQHVSMFEMGEAMQLRYRDNLNIYPTDTTEIKQNITEGGYDLELPSLNNSQGFPALDYLIHGLGENDTEILSYYTTNTDAQDYRTYLTDL